MTNLFNAAAKSRVQEKGVLRWGAQAFHMCVIRPSSATQQGVSFEAATTYEVALDRAQVRIALGAGVPFTALYPISAS